MRARWMAATLAGGALAVMGWWTGSREAGNGLAPAWAPTSALAGEIRNVGDGETFVSTDGGNAYLWRRNGDRIELVGQCVRTQGAVDDQATFVWLPGVERRS